MPIQRPQPLIQPRPRRPLTLKEATALSYALMRAVSSQMSESSLCGGHTLFSAIARPRSRPHSRPAPPFPPARCRAGTPSRPPWPRARPRPPARAAHAPRPAAGRGVALPGRVGRRLRRRGGPWADSPRKAPWRTAGRQPGQSQRQTGRRIAAVFTAGLLHTGKTRSCWKGSQRFGVWSVSLMSRGCRGWACSV